MSQLKALVIVDYQNIHLTAHELFAPRGTPKHETLVHPLFFANQLLACRGQTLMRRGVAGLDCPPQAQVERVMVFRGRPSNRHNPRSYARSLAQEAEWTRDRRVSQTSRTLQYIRKNGGDWEVHEKGIDVLLAITLVREARAANFDVILMASHDTDLEPAIDEAMSYGHQNIELAGWKGAKVLKPATRPWTTYLDGAAFVRSRDRKNYT